MDWQLDPRSPLARLHDARMSKNRDLKILITSWNSETGTGKSTLGMALALSFDPEFDAEEQATLDVATYLDRYPRMESGKCLIMDEAEQLDARRSNSHQNVEFSEKWMMLRVRNVTSILTLPTASALDKRLKELADIRINVVRRGLANVYRISVDDFDTSQVRERFWHELEWPDLSGHPEMRTLDRKKDKKIEAEVEELNEETVDPEEAKKDEKKRIAQRLREQGVTVADAADAVGMSAGWVSTHTQNPNDGVNAD